MIYLTLALSLILLSLLIDCFVTQSWVIKDRKTWIVFSILFVLTLVFDRVLVSAPVVIYTSSKILGVYLNHIPIEDFSYTFVVTIVPLSIKKYYENLL